MSHNVIWSGQQSGPRGEARSIRAAITSAAAELWALNTRSLDAAPPRYWTGMAVGVWNSRQCRSIADARLQRCRVFLGSLRVCDRL
jgi:hypothetical protein